MNSCKNCGNRVFDPDWGKVICSVYNHGVSDVDKYLDCKSHKPKDREETK